MVYASDANERLVGESRHTVDLKLTEGNYQRYLREGIPFDVTVRAPVPPRHAKVIACHYAADLVGSAIATLR